MYVRTYVRANVRTNVRIYAFIYVCMYVCVCVCVCVRASMCVNPKPETRNLNTQPGARVPGGVQRIATCTAAIHRRQGSLQGLRL